MRPPPKSLADLPDRIGTKIKLDPENVDERHACWIWQGAFTAARQREVKHRVPQDGPDRGYSQRDPTFVIERRTPSCHSAELGYAAPAHRVTFAECHSVAIRSIPRLSRCPTDACVSPWHTHALGPVVQRRRKMDPTAPAALEGYTDARCMTLLKAADGGEGVSAYITKDSAADEAGIPREQLSDECWARYVRENPD